MKQFEVKYKLSGYGYINIEAETEEEAEEEFYRVICNEECQNEENQWIDQDVLWDIEWTTTDVVETNQV